MKPFLPAVLVLIPLILSAAPLPEHSFPQKFNIGRPADPQSIQQLDIDIRPDGQGLPESSGTAEEGEKVYQQQCLACHGERGEGGINDKLVGRLPDDAFPFAGSRPPAKTIGNYWPYATTLFDYIRRTMPYTQPGSLSDQDVYSVTAYLLYLNGIIDWETELHKNNLPKIAMPSQGRFVNDDRLQFNKAH